MSRKNAPGAGRPEKDIDPEQVKRLASIQCTMTEMAAVLRCSVDTLENKFSDIIKEGQASGKMSLRRMMWAKANEGNVTMMIWLSKNALGMMERTEYVNQEKEEYVPLPSLVLPDEP